MMDIANTVWETCLNTFELRSFTGAYRKTFELVRADTDELRAKAFRLRYKVYCEEHGFEQPDENNPYVETDMYDNRAAHYILVHRLSREVAGTVRVVMPDAEYPDKSFPIQTICDHPLLQKPKKIGQFCEISKFCMAPRFRKRPEDGKILSSFSKQDTAEGHLQGMITYVRRKIAYAPAALLQGAFEAALANGISDCLWMVEPAHLPSLRRIGLGYKTLGPKVNYHGEAQPVIFNIKDALDSMRRVQPSCWEIVSDQGRLQHRADEVSRNNWHERIIDHDIRNQIFERLGEPG